MKKRLINTRFYYKSPFLNLLTTQKFNGKIESWTYLVAVLAFSMELVIFAHLCSEFVDVWCWRSEILSSFVHWITKGLNHHFQHIRVLVISVLMRVIIGAIKRRTSQWSIFGASFLTRLLFFTCMTVVWVICGIITVVYGNVRKVYSLFVRGVDFI